MATADNVKSKIQGLIDTANAATGGADDDLTQAVQSLIAGFGQVGYAELLYETTFTIEETNKTSTAVTVATISTGLNEPEGTEFYVVIECTNDTDADTSYNHIHARTQNLILASGGYGYQQHLSGILLTDLYIQNGTNKGIWISSVGRYGAKLTVQTKYTSESYGGAPSGEYRLRLYKLKFLEGA